MVLSVNSSGALSGYLSEEDGNIEFVTIATDLSSYTIETLSAVAVNITLGEVFKSSSGVGTTAYFVAGSGYLVSIDVGSSDVDLDN
jgi:hypothetical protein